MVEEEDQDVARGRLSVMTAWLGQQFGSFSSAPFRWLELQDFNPAVLRS